MSFVITMQGDMVPLEVEGDMARAMDDINHAAQNGRMLVQLGDQDEPVVINIRNINTMRSGEETFI